MAGKATEYIPWPGAGMPPGERTNPGGNKTAPDTKVVHGRYGWEWTEDDSQAVSDVKAAADAAKGIQRFINISTDQLTVTGTAFINEAIIQKIWTRIITAKEGEFGKLKAGMIEAHRVIADEVKAGAIDGMVITGATFQTGPKGSRPRILIDAQGMDVWDENNKRTLSVSSKGHVRVDGSVGISDSWSNCFFEDVTVEGGKDVDSDGVKMGVGLLFNRNTGTDYRVPGAITIRERVDKMPSIQLYAPSWTTSAANLELASGFISIWTPNGASMRIDNAGLRGFYKNNLTLECTDDHISFRGAKYRAGQFGVLGNGEIIALSWDWECDVSMYTTSDRGQVARLRANNHNLQVGSKDSYGFPVRSSGSMWVHGTLNADNKRFLIPHPLDPMNRGLQHWCTESPWPGVEYWDSVEVGSDGAAVVELPEYFNALHRPDLPVVVLCQGPGSPYASEVRLGRFTVHGEPGSRVYWLVKAVRRSGETRGDTYENPPVEGPYVWDDVLDGDEGDPLNPKDLRWLYEPPVPTE